MLVALVGVLAGIGAFFFFADDAPSVSYAPVDLPGSTLRASSVSPSIVEAFMTLKQPGFITVHESIGGAPGPIVAQTPYLDTASVGVSIPMTPPMTVGASYVALLFVDNGDQVFAIGPDLPVTSDGQPVRADFIAQAE